MSHSTHHIVVGVDYGTTYTGGVSYVESSKTSIDDINVIRQWPGPGKADSLWKVPSRIAYGSENGGGTKNHFGYEVLPKFKSYSWTKLLLDESASTTTHRLEELDISQSQGLMRLPPNKSALETVADYLFEVYRWMMSYLEKRIGSEVIGVTPIEFWFTVPAIWSDGAKAATEAAARRAGFASRDGDDIFLITEPEAAAVAVLKALAPAGGIQQIRPEDGVLVCDCGGGTVDLTTYKILKSQPELMFKELVVGTGAKCGSTYIDRKFYEWMSSIFGEAFDKLDSNKTGPGSTFMHDFESQKVDFGSSQDFNMTYEIRLVMPEARKSKYYDDEEYTVLLEGQNMKGFFDPTVQDIKNLIKNQIEQAEKKDDSCKINLIILVGGLGDSPYLNTALRRWCKQRKDLRLICPEHPQAAVMRGAALRGLEGLKPQSRKSRRYYGLSYRMPFRTGIDCKCCRDFCEWRNTWRCKNRMIWYIKRGQEIHEDTFIESTVKKRFKENERFWTRDLLSFSESEAPESCCKNAVEKVGTLELDLAGVDLSRFESKYINGEKWYCVRYKLIVMMGHKKGTLQFQATCQGQTMGRSSIRFNYQ